MDMHGQSILEQMIVRHGPREILGRYFAFADAAARKRGVTLRLRADFDRLAAVNTKHRDSCAPLIPILDPEHNSIDSKSAFWIEGIDEWGETVVTNAARLFDLGDRSLAEELRSLRVFYDDPAPHIAAGEFVEITAPSAARIRGRVTYAGALWVRPDYRGFGFAKIIPRLTRSYALTQWNSPSFWTIVDRALDDAGLTQAYGYLHSEERLITRLPTWRGDYDALFLSMDHDMLIHNVTSMLDETTTGFSRSSDTHIVKRSLPLERQGMSTRS